MEIKDWSELRQYLKYLIPFQGNSYLKIEKLS